MKEILANKRHLDEHETVNLLEECSVILQNKIPFKLRDPESFTIPCMIGDTYFNKALCYLSASNNLMPSSIFQKLRMRKVKLATVSL